MSINKLVKRKDQSSNGTQNTAQNGLRKKVKIDDSIYNPDTLLAKQQMNKLKTKNEKMGDKGIAQLL